MPHDLLPADWQPQAAADGVLAWRGIPGITAITSTVAGPLKLEPGEDGAVAVTYTPGYGDILRLTP